MPGWAWLGFGIGLGVVAGCAGLYLWMAWYFRKGLY